MKITNLTKEQVKRLETIRSNLRRAVNYMKKPEIVGIATATLPDRILGNTYIIKNPACCESMTRTPPAINITNHEAGSDIVGLYWALSMIEEFLDPPAPVHVGK